MKKSGQGPPGIGWIQRGAGELEREWAGLCQKGRKGCFGGGIKGELAVGMGGSVNSIE